MRCRSLTTTRLAAPDCALSQSESRFDANAHKNASMLTNVIAKEREAAAIGIRALIVEDEALGRRLLRTLLADLAGIEVVGEASSAVEARMQIHELRPDLVFMDIQMPGGGALEMLKGLSV